MRISEKVKGLINQDPQKKVVFYFDADGTIQDDLHEVEATGINVVHVTQQYFALKHRLETEMHGQEVFLYHPFAKPAGRELKKYPLLDLLKANHELRLDDASEFISEFGLSQVHLPLVKRHIKLLKSKTNQRKLANILDAEHFSESNLMRGLIAVVLGFNKVESRNVCIAKWLTIALDEVQLAKTNQQLVSLELDAELALWISQIMHKRVETLDSATATDCAQRIKYNVLTTHISRPFKEDTYAPQMKLSRAAEINRMQAFMNDWADSTLLVGDIERVFSQLGAEISEAKIVAWYGIAQEYGHYTKAMYQLIMAGLYDLAAKVPAKAMEESIRWRRLEGLPHELVVQVEFIYHYASMLSQLGAIKTYRLNTAEEYIAAYANELYKIDLHFRKALIAYEKSHDHFADFVDSASSLFENLNQKYDRHLITLNVEWQSILKEKAFDLKSINANKQYNFYQQEIEPFEHKIAVIISDAFRYELGNELYNELLADSKNQLTVEPYLSSIPSYTNLGMSNLLPNKGIAVKEGKEDLAFSINGISTVSTTREAILQMALPDSAVVSAKTVLKTTKLDDGRALFKPKVVYVYHDWIDAIGDKKGTERATFEATEKALDEIKKLIRKISSWNVKNILITADHGFLYSHNELQESQREVLPETSGFSVLKSRFVVTEKFVKPVDGYEFALRNTTNIDTDLKVAIPRAINRYRVQGNIGFQFSHGGGSLQEMIIPVIKYYKHVKEVAKQVTFRRIDEATEIRSGSIKIKILQDVPVSNEYKSRDLVIGLYSDEHELLSNEAELHINSTSANPRERVYEVILALTSKGSVAAYCHLRAFDKQDTKRLNPLALNDLLTVSSLMEKDEW